MASRAGQQIWGVRHMHVSLLVLWQDAAAKPAELLLANADIPMRFCFSWANEPWARTWDGKNHEILMPQSYGMEQDWKQHFDYLLPFFKDERYIKVDGCPMFLIYKPQSIPCAKQ